MHKRDAAYSQQNRSIHKYLTKIKVVSKLDRKGIRISNYVSRAWKRPAYGVFIIV